MTHFIVGAAGLTGATLAARLLADGEDVAGVDMAPKTARLPDALPWYQLDIRDVEALARLPFAAGDTVHHLAARQYHAGVPMRRRKAYFREVNLEGTRNVLQAMGASGCDRLIFFSTDMVYGIPERTPVHADAPLRPIDAYGESKALAEGLITEARVAGMNVTVFRPRLIVGPGRLGILTKLFWLIERGLPVPMIGNGANHYQMISVADCVTAVLRAVSHGVPNMTFNLGSDHPPMVRELLRSLIDHAGSSSILVPTPSAAVKAALGVLDRIGLTLMYPEQFQIADIDCRVDIVATKTALDWAPEFDDRDMLIAAFDSYVNSPP